MSITIEKVNNFYGKQETLADVSFSLKKGEVVGLLGPNGAGTVKDNWDLSVMRATVVTKILTNNPHVDLKQITSAGRSEYLPVDKDISVKTMEKNRRTEIILTSKLDELLKIIESN